MDLTDDMKELARRVAGVRAPTPIRVVPEWTPPVALNYEAFLAWGVLSDAR